jgi:predicted nucleic acid-binding protein
VSFLLDTNVVSEWVRPQPDRNVISWLAAVDEDRVFISVISFAEIRRGSRR